MHHGKDVWDILQITVGIITLGVLIYYTIRTAGIHTEARRQNDYAQRPCITLIYNDRGGLHYKNIGRGPAMEIFTVPFFINKYAYLFPQYGLLMASELSDLLDPEIQYFEKDAENPTPVTIGIDHIIRGNNIFVHIEYFDIDHIKYYSDLYYWPSVQKIDFHSTGRENE